MHGPTYWPPVQAATLVSLTSKVIGGIAVGYSFTPMKRCNSAQPSVNVYAGCDTPEIADVICGTIRPKTIDNATKDGTAEQGQQEQKSEVYGLGLIRR